MKYRFYSFVNHLYMSQLQWGIQTAHAVSTMAFRYKHNTRQWKQYCAWATEEPTITVCQGGNVASLTDLETKIFALSAELHLPCASFKEDFDSLGGVLTCVAVLLPETMYDVGISTSVDGRLLFTREPEIIDQDSFPVEHALLSIVRTARLA